MHIDTVAVTKSDDCTHTAEGCVWLLCTVVVFTGVSWVVITEVGCTVQNSKKVAGLCSFINHRSVLIRNNYSKITTARTYTNT